MTLSPDQCELVVTYHKFNARYSSDNKLTSEEMYV